MRIPLSPDAACLLSKTHDRSQLDCGVEPLNRYLRQQARQDMERHISVTFVLPDSEQVVRGFYHATTRQVPASTKRWRAN